MNDAVIYLAFKLTGKALLSSGDVSRALGFESVEFMSKMDRMVRGNLLVKRFVRERPTSRGRAYDVLFMGYGLTLRGHDEARKLGLLL